MFKFLTGQLIALPFFIILIFVDPYSLWQLKKKLTVVACTSGNLVIQVQHGFSFKKIG